MGIKTATPRLRIRAIGRRGGERERCWTTQHASDEMDMPAVEQTCQ